MQVSLDNSVERRNEFHMISKTLNDPLTLDARWHEFCCSQRKHILKEMFKGFLAMMPAFLKYALFSRSLKVVKPSCNFAKGARMWRGMFQCENHTDVLARIFRDYSNGNF